MLAQVSAVANGGLELTHLGRIKIDPPREGGGGRAGCDGLWLFDVGVDAGEALFLKAEGLAADVDKGGTMEEPVEGQKGDGPSCFVFV